MKVLNNQRGETLVETIVSILVLTMILATVAMITMSAVNMTAVARRGDRLFDEELTAANLMDTSRGTQIDAGSDTQVELSLTFDDATVVDEALSSPVFYVTEQGILYAVR